MSRINIKNAGLTKEHILKAIEKFHTQIENQTFNSDRESVVYNLIYEGNTYPPKYIAELAYNLKYPNNKIGPSRHSAPDDIKFLKSLGFKVENKDKRIVISDSQLQTLIKVFIEQATTKNLKSKKYNHTTYKNTFLQVSFGQGNKAVIPWMALLSKDQTVSKGIYPVLLFNTYTDEIVIAYGVSETNEPSRTWPKNILDKVQIKSLSWPRYNTSYIFSHYNNVSSQNIDELAKKLMLDIQELTKYYTSIFEKGEANRVEEEKVDKQYFWLNANSKYWSFSNYDVGDEQSYSAYNEKGNKRRIFENFEKAKPGDLIIGYEASPTKKVVALCEVTEPLREDDDGEMILPFTIKELFTHQPSWDELKMDKRLQESSIINNRQGSLFSLTEEEYSTVIEYTKPKGYGLYNITDALKEIFIKKEDLERIGTLLQHKKNIILQGPPGVGKTFIAKRLAYLQMGKKDSNRIQMIQFHQSYAYEDFIQGFRPNEDGTFELTNGVFYRFCKKAQNNPTQDYYFIIDEINRGNLSKIFGELMMLIEHDKRGGEFAIPLTYARNDSNLFYIPKNLHVIGTMNTADRSLAMVDYALRRRFAFIDIKPNFNKAFRRFLHDNEIQENIIDKICKRVDSLNERIEEDKNLGKGFSIGHSYFCNFQGAKDREEWYEQIIENEIGPMLYEYWFDDEDKAQQNVEQLLE